ncbi:hypothetical protein AGMMS50239_32800 [Bacteroidia bacterium]|nr:hypothetical protein AGMMS50239_32800 [Bacteroidia bacterium]
MKKILYALILTVLILSTNACIKEEWGGIIEGKIIDFESKPIEGANVLLVQTGESFTTKSDGKYMFKELNEELFDFYVKKDGYKDDTKQIKAQSGKTIRIDITLKKEE